MNVPRCIPIDLMFVLEVFNSLAADGTSTKYLDKINKGTICMRETGPSQCFVGWTFIRPGPQVAYNCSQKS
jgi:hypothetical protein